jgi:8-oxo-dGTP pyrophosphatase MutT (NUDIX family)
MPILTTLHRADCANDYGKILSRTSVRGVSLRGRDLLMIHEAAGGYKFPGGGIDEGESQAEALTREMLEECGASVVRIQRELGTVIEYKPAFDDGFDTFQMISHYFLCEVADDLGPQHLNEYEANLGFEPRWVTIEAALRENRALLETVGLPKWLPREIFMLEYLQRAKL